MVSENNEHHGADGGSAPAVAAGGLSLPGGNGGVNQNLNNSTGMSTPQIKNHTATLFNKKLYIFGGYDGKKNHCNLRMFDTDKDCWQKSIKPGGTPP